MSDSTPHSGSDFDELRETIKYAYAEGPARIIAMKRLDRIEEQLQEEQRAFRAYKEHVQRSLEAFSEEVRP